MIEEAAVDVSGNNLESITAEPFFKKTSSLIYLYTLRLRVDNFFVLKKKMEKGLGVMIENEFYLTWKL